MVCGTLARQDRNRLDSSTAILDSSRQLLDSLDSLDSSCQAVKSTASRQLLDSSTATRGSGAVKAVKLSTRQLDSLDSSTARQLRLGLPCMDWWLHLIWFALFEVHPSRKVSLDKCSHQGSAHWQQYALHGAPSHQGVTPSWRRPLRSDGVPLVLGGCHMCQEGCPMMRQLLGHLHEHGITLGVPPNGWEAPHHCARE